jgi:adenylate cyclase
MRARRATWQFSTDTTVHAQTRWANLTNGAAQAVSSYKMRRLFHALTFKMAFQPAQLPQQFSLHQFTKVLLVMDVVESVRLMEENERDVVERWQQLAEHVVTAVLPSRSGRLVKSLGDGLMLEFPSGQDCVGAAFAIQEFSRAANEPFGPGRRMHLRMGAHVAEFVADKRDIYGAGVNLAARLAGLAGPGEIVVSAELRDQLAPSLDADIEDLGDCYLKHVARPVRTYRVTPPGSIPVIQPDRPKLEVLPTIAVIPFEARSNEPEHFAIGELIADGIIAQLSRTTGLRVISRLSTTRFRGRQSSLEEMDLHLAATYVLSGGYVASGGKLLVMAELADVRNNQIVWAERLSGETGDLLQAHSELLNRIATVAHKTLLEGEVQRALTQPLPRLDSSSLLLSGISLMHRASQQDFDRSREALDAVIDRHSRAATARAWLAKWHILKIIRGISDSPDTDMRLALDQTRRALDVEPDNALTLAVEGHAYCQLVGDFSAADTRLSRALAVNPNEPMAWLFKSVLSTMWGSAEESVTEVDYAAALSPVDPLRYYFDMLRAAALLTNNDHGQAIAFATQSLRSNRHHSPTLRTLLTAQVEAGHMDAARDSLQRLLAEEPGLTVSSYLKMGSSTSVTRQRCASAMRKLGLREN